MLMILVWGIFERNFYFSGAKKVQWNFIDVSG